MTNFKKTGRAFVDPDSPQPFGQCDRCSFLYNLRDLTWQFQINGLGAVNTRLLVCETCLDALNPQFQNVPLPADPPPILNARPEPYMLDEVDLLSTEDDIPITTEDGVGIVPNQPSQNFSTPPEDPTP